MALQNVVKHNFSKLLTPKEVAEVIRRSESSLARDRYQGRGLPYIRFNRRVYYRIEDIRRYVSEHVIETEIGVAN